MVEPRHARWASVEFPDEPGLGARPSADEAPEGLGPAGFARTLSIRDLMTEALVDTAADGSIWARSRDLRASLSGDGLVVYPVFGRQSPREWPVRLSVASVTCGETYLGSAPVGMPARFPGRIELERGGLREVYHLGVEEIEQTFVFDELPGDGDLVVRLDVETDLDVVDDGEELRFVHASYGEVVYGSAFVLDAAGAREPIGRTWTGDGFELRVPAAFLARAVLPVTIDPPIHSFSNGFGVADDTSPDIVFCGQTNEYLVCWQEFTSADNSDVYLTKFSQTGSSQGAAFAIEMGTGYWAEPRIAYAYGPDRALVVASVNPDGLGGPNGSARGRLVDVGAFQPVAPEFTISTVGTDKHDVDVGGSNHDSLSSTHFCVVWSQEMANGHGKIQYRTIDWDGSWVTGIIDATGDPYNDVQPAISKSLGDVYAGSDYWTIAWIRDNDGDGRGFVCARRISWNGDPSVGAGNFTVDGSPDSANPTVTSQFDVPLEYYLDRPSIVAFDRRFASADHPSGYQRDVAARVVVDGDAMNLNSLSTYLEDFDMKLDQWGPSITTDGRAFSLSYHEEWWSGIGSENWDMYMLSGNIVDLGLNVRLALSERHQELASTLSPDARGRLCSIADGEANTTSDDGACVWVREDADPFGQIEGSTFDNPTDQNSDERAVGIQYCVAIPNSEGSFGGRNSSWLSILGDGTLGTIHVATAVDLPLNQFGYLAVSQTTAWTDGPGGSAGRLCLGGSIGRYVFQVGNTGSSGTIATNIDPLAIPQPTGPVQAIPGESWSFQLWHRDIVDGVPTSNFTNGCTVVFKP